MKRKILILFYVSLLLSNVIHIWAAPLRLTVQPKGTNQVELTLEPVLPNLPYEVMARTNGPTGHWIRFAGCVGGSNGIGSVLSDLGTVPGLTLRTLRNWTFVAGRWDAVAGDELPWLYKELAMRVDPFSYVQPYGSPFGDGWNNLEKLNNDMDPRLPAPPPSPRLNVSFRVSGTNGHSGNAVLTWESPGLPTLDYFVIQRANRTLRLPTNNVRQMPAGPNRLPGTPWSNPGPNQRANFPPNFRNFPGHGAPFETGPLVEIAQIAARTNGGNYRYVDTNVDVFSQPKYGISSHHSAAYHGVLAHINEAAIRATIISVGVVVTTNGFALTVPRPLPYASYLLLVRDRNDRQWRASGYFQAGTNQAAVHLQVNKAGMMTDGQKPSAMPQVKFLTDVVQPEFVAGWGEDSDGDGLPDIYEVLVTHTRPDNADTGNTGILDGYKEMAGDGLNNLEKFRRRADPQKTAHPPATVELIRPTAFEIADALTPKTDLYCDIQLNVRRKNHVHFESLEMAPTMLSEILDFRQPESRKDFDLRVAWRLAPPERRAGNPYPDDPPWLPLLEPLINRINGELTEAFKRHLETNAPLSWDEAHNLEKTIMQDYHEGNVAIGNIMIEMAAIEDNIAQDFYGKVIDQHGDPVVGAKVTAKVNHESGPGGSATTQTDSDGLFQFTGLRGKALNITPEKEGFQIQGHGLGLKNLNGPESTSIRPAIYTMWKLRNPEPMLHGKIGSYTIRHGSLYAVDLVKNTITEGTNRPCDFWIQIDGPVVFKRGDFDDWSLTMTAVDGGFIEATENQYFNQAPSTGYQPNVKMVNRPSVPSLPRLKTDRTFYLKSRGGQIYSYFRITELMPHNFGKFAQFYIDYYANPAGSMNLQFDPAKQIK